jgi:hypothetical protein
MPTLTIRLHPAHHQIVRDIAARLKADSAFAARLQALLTDSTPAPDAVAELQARVEALEAWRTSIAAPPGNPSHLCEHLKSPAEPERSAREASPDASQQLADAPGLFDSLAPTAAASTPTVEEQRADQPPAPLPSPSSTNKPKRRQITQEQRTEVERLDADGKRGFEIVQITGISQPSVSRIIAAARAGLPQNRTRSGIATPAEAGGKA